jgi:hypothetical protein
MIWSGLFSADWLWHPLSLAMCFDTRRAFADPRDLENRAVRRDEIVVATLRHGVLALHSLNTRSAFA